MTEYENLYIVISLIYNTLVLLSLIYAALQFKRSACIHRENIEWSKRNETAKKLAEYNNLESAIVLNKNFNYIGNNDPIPYSEIKQAIDENIEVDVHLSRFMNYIESIAVGIENNIYDEIFVKSLRKTAMIQIYNSFKEFVEYHRRNGSPRCYISYESLKSKWETEDRQVNRLPRLGNV